MSLKMNLGHVKHDAKRKDDLRKGVLRERYHDSIDLGYDSMEPSHNSLDSMSDSCTSDEEKGYTQTVSHMKNVQYCVGLSEKTRYLNIGESESSSGYSSMDSGFCSINSSGPHSCDFSSLTSSSDESGASNKPCHTDAISKIKASTATDTRTEFGSEFGEKIDKKVKVDPVHAYSQTGDVRYLFANCWQRFFVQNADGDTGLHLAVINQQEAIFNLILNLLPNPKYLDIYNDLTQTALHLAVVVGHAKFVERLIDRGADITKVDRNGQTCLHLACLRGNLNVVHAIIKARPQRSNFDELLLEVLETKNFEGLTPLHIAVLKNNFDIAKMVKPIKAVELIQILVTLGADVNARTGKSGYTCLHLAVEENNFPIISYLLFETNIDIDAVSYSDCTALHLAAGLGLTDVVALLVATGADQSIENTANEMACDLACDDYSDFMEYRCIDDHDC